MGNMFDEHKKYISYFYSAEINTKLAVIFDYGIVEYKTNPLVSNGKGAFRELIKHLEETHGVERNKIHLLAFNEVSR